MARGFDSLPKQLGGVTATRCFCLAPYSLRYARKGCRTGVRFGAVAVEQSGQVLLSRPFYGALDCRVRYPRLLIGNLTTHHITYSTRAATDHYWGESGKSESLDLSPTPGSGGPHQDRRVRRPVELAESPTYKEEGYFVLIM